MSKLLKRLFILAAVLVVILCIAAVTLIVLFPAEKIRDMALDIAGEALGMPVSIGEVSLSVFGIPAIRVDDIAAGSVKDGDPFELAVESLYLRPHLMKLFRKEIEITLIEVRKPAVTLAAPPDSPDTPDEAPVPPGTETAKEAGPPPIPLPVTLKKLKVRDAALAMGAGTVENPAMLAESVDVDMGMTVSRDLSDIGTDISLTIGNIVMDTGEENGRIEGVRATFKGSADGDLTKGDFIMDSASLSVNRMPLSVSATMENWTDVIISLAADKLEINDILKSLPEQFALDEDLLSFDGVVSFAVRGAFDSSAATILPKFTGNFETELTAKMPQTFNHPTEIKLVSSISPYTMRINRMTVQSGASDLMFNGELRNYMSLAGFSSETAVFVGNLSSKVLDIGDLMVAPENEDNAETAPLKPWEFEESVKQLPIPPNLEGELSAGLNTIRFGKLHAESASARLVFGGGSAELKDLKIEAYSGTFGGAAKVDFHDIENIAYSGDFTLKELSSGKLIADFLGGQEIFAGKLNSKLSFSGAGLDSVSMLDNLKASGSMLFNEGSIQNFGMTKQLGEHLKFLDFEKVDFKSITNSFKVEDRKFVTPDMAIATDFGDIRVDGFTGFDSSIGYDITLDLDRETSAKALKSLSSLTKYIDSTPERLELNIAAGGTLTSPKFKLDTSTAEDVLKKSLKKQVTKEVDKLLDSKDAEELKEKGKKLLKKIFR